MELAGLAAEGYKNAEAYLGPKFRKFPRQDYRHVEKSETLELQTVSIKNGESKALAFENVDIKFPKCCTASSAVSPSMRQMHFFTVIINGKDNWSSMPMVPIQISRKEDEGMLAAQSSQSLSDALKPMPSPLSQASVISTGDSNLAGSMNSTEESV